MKVRIVTCLAAIALVVATGARVSAGQPSRSALDEMGLGSLSVMSDDDALAVRGMGYHSTQSVAKAWGHSWAQISAHGGTAGSENGYDAAGKHSASGSNLSFAGVAIIEIKGHKSGKPGGDMGGGDMGGWSGSAPTSRMGGGSSGGGNNYGGGKSHGGGTISVKTVVVFAGGSSTARAH